jgi:serine O-acetyltransferase
VQFRDLCQLIATDLHRHAGSASPQWFVKYVLSSPGFTYTVWLRVAAYLERERSVLRVFSPLARVVKHHLSLKYGISIPTSTRIGEGFYIGHFGGIVVNGDCRIGRDCNISQDVTLGRANRGPRRGAPVIGDRVYIGPGAKLVGAVRVGSNVAIGANAVVTTDIPDNAVVAGVPARVISYGGSVGYVNRTDYPEPTFEHGAR